MRPNVPSRDICRKSEVHTGAGSPPFSFEPIRTVVSVVFCFVFLLPYQQAPSPDSHTDGLW